MQTYVDVATITLILITEHFGCDLLLTLLLRVVLCITFNIFKISLKIIHLIFFIGVLFYCVVVIGIRRYLARIVSIICEYNIVRDLESKYILRLLLSYSRVLSLYKN